MFRKYLIKPIIEIFYKPLVLWYLSKDRNYRYGNIRIMVRKGVFHPGLFFSTKLLLSYLSHLNLDGKKVLELGSGTGLISIFAAKEKAIVTSVDISKTAVECTKENALVNSVHLEIKESDLFDGLDNYTFDIIVFNPPYYPKKINSDNEYAWFCGENHDYFTKLFSQLNNYIHPKTIILMSWSEDSNIAPVISIAEKNGFHLTPLVSKWIWFEMNFIYQIKRQNLEFNI